MNRIFVHGYGVVSSAGWGLDALRAALLVGEAIPLKPLVRPGWESPLLVRSVPVPAARPAFLNHARLRRTSPISHFAVAAALEALGGDAAQVQAGALRLGIIFCVMDGCVNYSRRFYDEALRDPATASPLVFPETVFNAPASHLAALLDSTAINYTLVGDPGTFLQGLSLAADWLLAGRVEGCLVVGAEELDWLTGEAFHLFDRRLILSEGAGAVYLRRESAGSHPQLDAVSDACLFTQQQSRAQAARLARAEMPLGSADELLCDGTQNRLRFDAAELAAWHDWRGDRLAVKKVLGEGLPAAAAWQCVAALDALQQGRYRAATVSVVGCNQQAIAARFVS